MRLNSIIVPILKDEEIKAQRTESLSVPVLE